MGGPGRIIFPTTNLTHFLVEGFKESTKRVAADMINPAVIRYYTPQHPILYDEVQQLFARIENTEEIPSALLKATLARVVRSLKDSPISDYSTLEQIMFHFRTALGNAMRYDYILIVDSEQDALLRELNAAIKTKDPDYNMGCRELGERSRELFAHWDYFCGYSDTYVALATIIDLEDIYLELTPYRTICLINDIDSAIRQSPAKKKKGHWPISVSLEDRYYAERYQVMVYQADNGYCALSGDTKFENKAYYNYSKRLIKSRSKNSGITEKDVEELEKLNFEGQEFLRSVAKYDNTQRK